MCGVSQHSYHPDGINVVENVPYAEFIKTNRLGWNNETMEKN